MVISSALVRWHYPLMPSHNLFLESSPFTRNVPCLPPPSLSMHVVQSASPFLALQRREFHHTLKLPHCPL